MPPRAVWPIWNQTACSTSVTIFCKAAPTWKSVLISGAWPSISSKTKPISGKSRSASCVTSTRSFATRPTPRMCTPPCTKSCNCAPASARISRTSCSVSAAHSNCPRATSAVTFTMVRPSISKARKRATPGSRFTFPRTVGSDLTQPTIASWTATTSKSAPVRGTYRGTQERKMTVDVLVSLIDAEATTPEIKPAS
jgi:hypothetical protein